MTDPTNFFRQQTEVEQSAEERYIRDQIRNSAPPLVCRVCSAHIEDEKLHEGYHAAGGFAFEMANQFHMERAERKRQAQREAEDASLARASSFRGRALTFVRRLR